MAVPPCSGSVTWNGEQTRGVQNDAIQPRGTSSALKRTLVRAGASTRTAYDDTPGSATAWHVPAARAQAENRQGHGPMLRRDQRGGNKPAYSPVTMVRKPSRLVVVTAGGAERLGTRRPTLPELD